MSQLTTYINGREVLESEVVSEDVDYCSLLGKVLREENTDVLTSGRIALQASLCHSLVLHQDSSK